MGWYNSGKTYLALSIVIPIAGVAYVVTKSSNTSVLILSALSFLICYPMTFMGLYMWATGNGKRWVNGFDWPKYTDDQCRSIVSAVGLATAICMVVLCLGLTLILWNTIAGIVVTILSIAVIIIPVIFICLRKGTIKPFNGVCPKKIALVICICSIMIVPCCYFATSNSPVNDNIEITMGETSFAVKAPFFNHTFEYDEVEKLYIIDNFDKGNRISGSATSTLCSGKWNNASYGDYELAIDPRVNKVISVKSNGNCYVFNLQTEEKTINLYNELVIRTTG